MAVVLQIKLYCRITSLAFFFCSLAGNSASRDYSMTYVTVDFLPCGAIMQLYIVTEGWGKEKNLANTIH